MLQILMEVHSMERDCVSVEKAGRRIGLSRGESYMAAKRGKLPVLKFGRRLVVPVKALERMLEMGQRTEAVK